MFQGLIAKILVLLVILSLGALAHSNPRLRQVVPIVATPIILKQYPNKAIHYLFRAGLWVYATRYLH